MIWSATRAWPLVRPENAVCVDSEPPVPCLAGVVLPTVGRRAAGLAQRVVERVFCARTAASVRCLANPAILGVLAPYPHCPCRFGRSARPEPFWCLAGRVWRHISCVSPLPWLVGPSPGNSLSCAQQPVASPDRRENSARSPTVHILACMKELASGRGACCAVFASPDRRESFAPRALARLRRRATPACAQTRLPTDTSSAQKIRATKFGRKKTPPKGGV